MNAATLAIIQLILTYGIPGAVQIYQTINKEDITQADLDKLKDINPPEWYFPAKA
jgi:hypothetical protein